MYNETNNVDIGYWLVSYARKNSQLYILLLHLE